MGRHRFPIFIGIVVLCLICLPYLYAVIKASPDRVFAGFLFNPQDGASYLAKMYQGWRGDWRFTLPFSEDPGRGAYLFLFYLALGHLARWLGLSLIFTFHAARLAGTAGLLLALYRFMAASFHETPQLNLAFALAALGSGLGWLASLFGAFTADFWVAEAYPFLSAFATPHFVLGLALLLWLLTPRMPGKPIVTGWQVLARTVASLLLAVISPFGVVIALMITGSLAVWEKIRPCPKSIPEQAPDSQLTAHVVDFFSILLSAGPLLIYTIWVVSQDAALAGWNAQNLTPSPPPWNVFLALSPVLLLALAGLPAAWRLNQKACRLWLSWAALGLLLLYAPFGLQRRFMMGIYVPLSALSVYGLVVLAQKQRGRSALLVAGLFLLATPTNILILMAARQGIQTQDAQLYLSRGEIQALSWLVESTPQDARVIAAPETGLFIPAFTGRRVFYGHPFETVNAASARSAVIDYFLSAEDARILPASWDPDYVWFGPREQALSDFRPDASLYPVYSADGVTIYAVGQ